MVVNNSPLHVYGMVVTKKTIDGVKMDTVKKLGSMKYIYDKVVTKVSFI